MGDGNHSVLTYIVIICLSRHKCQMISLCPTGLRFIYATLAQ